MSLKSNFSYLLFSIFTILVITTICSAQATSLLWSSNLTETDRNIQNSGDGNFLSFLAISDDGKTIATATADGVIYLINDAETIFRNETSVNETSEILSLSLSPDGNYLAFSDAGSSPASNPPKRISLLDRNGEELWSHSTRTFVFHSAVSSNGLYSVFGSYENITAVDRNGSILWNHPVASPVISLDISDDGEYIVAATENGEVLSLNQSGFVLWENQFRSPSDIKISSDGNYVCLTTYLRKVFFMDDRGNILWNRTLPQDTKFAKCGISYNGEKIVVRTTGAVSGYDRSGSSMWNYSTDYQQPLTHPISAPVFSLSEDGRYSVVAAGDSIIVLADKGNETGTFSFDDEISGVGISSDGTKIAAITLNELYYFDNPDAGSNSSTVGQTGDQENETSPLTHIKNDQA